MTSSATEKPARTCHQTADERDHGWPDGEVVDDVAVAPLGIAAVAALAQAGKPARERIAEAVTAAVTTCEQDGRVRIPGVARCIADTK